MADSLSQQNQSLPFFYNSTVALSPDLETEEEEMIIEERRRSIKSYVPPYTTCETTNLMSGDPTVVPMTTKTSIHTISLNKGELR